MSEFQLVCFEARYYGLCKKCPEIGQHTVCKVMVKIKEISPSFGPVNSYRDRQKTIFPDGSHFHNTQKCDRNQANLGSELIRLTGV